MEEGVEHNELMRLFMKQVYEDVGHEGIEACANRIVCLLEDIAISLRKSAACDIGSYNLLAEAQKIAKEQQNGTES